jgi:hypothetical protein
MITMSARNNFVYTAFPLWLVKPNDESPNPEQFTEDPASVVSGQQVDDRELRRVVTTPDARVLVDGAPIDRSSRENAATAAVQCGTALSIGLSINSSPLGARAFLLVSTHASPGARQS